MAPARNTSKTLPDCQSWELVLRAAEIMPHQLRPTVPCCGVGSAAHELGSAQRKQAVCLYGGSWDTFMPHLYHKVPAAVNHRLHSLYSTKRTSNRNNTATATK